MISQSARSRPAKMSAPQTLHSPWPPRAADDRRETNLCPPRPHLGDHRGGPHPVRGHAGLLSRRTRTPRRTRCPIRELFDLPREGEPAHGVGEDSDGSRDQLGPRCRDLGHPRRRRWNRIDPRNRQWRARPVGRIIKAEPKADSSEGLAQFLDGRRHRVEDALQVVEELLELVRRHRPFGRRLDESLLFQNPEGITHLVLREVQEFGQADDADRLVLHDRLEHRDMALQKLDLGLNLAGERTPAGHGLPPLHNVTWYVLTWSSLKRSTLR